MTLPDPPYSVGYTVEKTYPPKISKLAAEAEIISLKILRVEHVTLRKFLRNLFTHVVPWRSKKPFRTSRFFLGGAPDSKGIRRAWHEAIHRAKWHGYDVIWVAYAGMGGKKNDLHCYEAIFGIDEPERIYAFGEEEPSWADLQELKEVGLRASEAGKRAQADTLNTSGALDE